MELYILRHGTTQWNKTARLQGRTDIPLDEEGIRLAKETGDALADVRFDAVYSSPLKRAYDTAKYVLKDRDLPIQVDERLIEVSFGDLEGMSQQNNGSRKKQDMDSLKFDISTFHAPPNGESMQHLLDRTHSFYEDVIHDPKLKGKRVLVSMHGGSGRALMHSVWKDNDFWHGKVPPNCSVCIVTVEDGEVTDVRQDCTFYKETPKEYY